MKIAVLVRTKILLINMLIAVMLCSCNEHTLFHSYANIRSYGWNKTDTLKFQFAVTDSLAPYYIYLDVRNTTEYPYRNLAVDLFSNIPDTLIRQRLRYQCILADTAGNQIGKGLGGIYQNEFYLGKLYSPKKGVYRLNLVHRMSDLQLQGIHNIGLRIARK